MYGDDEKNSVTHNILALHLGGVDSLSRRSGIHGHHLDHYEYVATDATNQTIIAVNKKNPDGSITQFVSGDWKGPVKGVTRQMDCMDCHNQATHIFQTPEDAVDEAMQDGGVNPLLPFVHKKGMELIQAEYKSQDEAAAKITAGLGAFYQSQYPAIWNGQRGAVDGAAKTLVAIYKRNIFPEMKVTWGTYPNGMGHSVPGHNPAPGCFRCHDGNHTSKDGKTITNDCSVCHNLLASDEANPKQLSDLGIQQSNDRNSDSLRVRMTTRGGGAAGHRLVSSSRMAVISASACWLPVQVAAAMPASRRSRASSVRPSVTRVWADIWYAGT